MQIVKNINQIGLLATIFLVMSNMLGSGVFMLPATLAEFGNVSIWGWVIAMMGVIAMALVFARLSFIIPNGAGPYGYVKEAFGEYLGFQTNYVYSIASWIGNVSMISVIIGYLATLIPALNNMYYSVILQLIIIWTFTWLNLRGARIVGIFQSATLLVALVPIVLVAVFGWFWFDKSIFLQGWNVPHVSTFSSINQSFNNIMWAFIGIESACVSANVVKNAKRNIPLATIFGVLAATVLYISTCIIIMGIIPNAKLATSSAPFADAMSIVFGSKISMIIVFCAVINCLGSLAGWTLVIGQTAKAAAEDGLFPKFCATTNSRGVPSQGLIALAIIMSIVVFLTISPTANEQFSKIITMSVILYLIPYIYCGFAMLKLGKARVGSKDYLLYVILGIIAAMFFMWSILGSDKPITVWAFLIIISSTLFFAFKRK